MQAHNFTVPVAKPMPMSHKGHHVRHMIYTSPTVPRTEPPPEVIPIARQANAMDKKVAEMTDVRPTMGMVSLEHNNGVSAAMNRTSMLYGIRPVKGGGQAISPTHALHVLRESE